MKVHPFLLIVVIAVSACQQKNSSDKNLSIAVPDLKSENVKGSVQKIEAETYLIDSATGKQGKLDSRSTETYNEKGYETAYTFFSAKDSSTMVYHYDHDSSGFITTMSTTKNNKPFSSMQIQVDSAGHYTLAKSFDSTGKIDAYYDTIESNIYGEVLSAKGHHPDSTLKMTFTNHYDSVFYVGGESKDSVGKLTYSSTVKLNDKKDPEQMQETSVTKDSTTKTSTTYRYDNQDNQGNWTQQTITENGKPKKIVKRTITYQP